MKLVDVVNQLALILPKYTDKFSVTLAITSIVASGGIATIETASPHGLTTGKAVTITGAQSKTPIDSVSKDGLIFTFETSADHDLTFGWTEHTNVALNGFTDSAWNDTFTLMDVPNRRTFKVQSTNSLPTLNGNEILFENKNTGINGRYAVTVIDTDTFTISGDFDDDSYFEGTVNSGVRIAGSVDIERTLEEYTKQNISDLWMFVSMHDVETSKDRSTLSDATATIATGQTMRLRLIDGFTLYVFVNTTKDIAAQDAVDITRHDLLLPILKSVYGARFDTGLSSEGDFRTIMTGHGFSGYNKPVYVHLYNFELSMDLTDDDTVEPGDTRAFRDIDYTHEFGDEDVTDMTVKIDLDDTIITPL